MEHFPFSKLPLPYGYTALVPNLDPDTVYLHYDKIYAGDVDTLNFLISPHPKLYSWGLRRLVTEELPVPLVDANRIRHFAGSVHNHNLYFHSACGSKSGRVPEQSRLAAAIAQQYGSLTGFQELFIQAAFDLPGSGWVWLNALPDGTVHISITGGNATPALRLVTPIFAADLWEHAYFLPYPARPADYLRNWFGMLDWTRAEQIYLAALAR